MARLEGDGVTARDVFLLACLLILAAVIVAAT